MFGHYLSPYPAAHLLRERLHWDHVGRNGVRFVGGGDWKRPNLAITDRSLLQLPKGSVVGQLFRFNHDW